MSITSPGQIVSTNLPITTRAQPNSIISLPPDSKSKDTSTQPGKSKEASGSWDPSFFSPLGAEKATASQPSAYHVARGVKGYYPIEQTQAFVTGVNDVRAIAPNDVSQGKSDTCVIDAISMSLANSQRGRMFLTRIIEDKGSFYRIHMGGQWLNINTRKIMSMPVARGDFNGQTSNPKWEIWPKCMEAAYINVMHYQYGIDLSIGGTTGTNGKLGMEVVTGQKAFAINPASMSDQQISSSVTKALNEQKVIITGTKDASFFKAHGAEVKKYGLTDSHAYAVLGINQQNNTIWLGDPHGRTLSVPLDVYKQYFNGLIWSYVP